MGIVRWMITTTEDPPQQCWAISIFVVIHNVLKDIDIRNIVYVESDIVHDIHIIMISDTMCYSCSSFRYVGALQQ